MHVNDGTVQWKNNWLSSRPDLPRWSGVGPIPVVLERARRGYRHLVHEDDVRAFIAIVPEWHVLARGLRCIVLGKGDDDVLGRYHAGVLCLHAWGALEDVWETAFVDEHRDVLETLMVEMSPHDDGIELSFTPDSARAFQLLHVFLHELGHHVDRMSTNAKVDMPRGEPFAETFANDLAARTWPAYARRFAM